MNIKNISIPINKIEFSETTNPSLKRCSIYVMHTGENFNGSSFSEESVAKAKETLKNIPILASIKRDENYNPIDFEGHEIEYRIIENSNGSEFKTVYIEQPIGLIPETNNYRIETVDDEKWVVCDGYIWSIYSNGAYEMLKGSDKKVSMEIEVQGGMFDDNYVYHINDYHYTGVTVLGDDYSPAMNEIASISMYNADNSIKKEYSRLLHEIQSLGKEEDDMPEENIEVVDTEEVVADETVETPEDETVEENEEVVADEENQEEPVEGDESETEESVEGEAEGEIFEVKYNEVLSELNELKAQYVDLESNFTALNDEVAVLREYKLNIERQAKDEELNGIFQKYSQLSEFDGYKEVFEKRYELSKEEIEKSLKIIGYDNGVIINSKQEFSKKETIKIPVVNDASANTGTAWDILNSYIKN